MSTVDKQRKHTDRKAIQRQFTRVAACAMCLRRLTSLGISFGEAIVVVVRQFELSAEETRLLLDLF
jgi:hypothetical protein